MTIIKEEYNPLEDESQEKGTLVEFPGHPKKRVVPKKYRKREIPDGTDPSRCIDPKGDPILKGVKGEKKYFTKTSNTVLEITAYRLWDYKKIALLSYIIRKTFGWEGHTCKVKSIMKLSQWLNMDFRELKKFINELLEEGWISIFKNKQNHSFEITLLERNFIRKLDEIHYKKL